MASDKEIIKYYMELDRAYFMGENRKYAGFDAAFPIGYGQTISQPSLVLDMTLKLGLSKDCRVLEIGTGSGYQTALLAAFSKEVYTVEIIEPLKVSAEERLLRMGFRNIHFKLGDGSRGWEEEAPFDRIMVTAAAHRIPTGLLEQLAPGGGMIIPVGGHTQKIMVVSKEEDGRITIREDIPVVFVKLVGDY